MLNYSDEGLAARPTFFDPYNDITIIVEDSGKENFYTQIMVRLLPDLRIDSVLGVGGKRQVLDRFNAQRNEKNGRREFFLIDGDYDELLGYTIPESKVLYRLHRYDIESYLIEETAICTIAEEESPWSTSAQYQKLLAIDRWMTTVMDSAIRLAGCVALLQELGSSQAGISQSIERYVDKSSGLPDEAKIEEQIAKVMASGTFKGHGAPEDLLEEMVHRMGKCSRERGRWISGKDILIPLLIKLLQRNIKRPLAKESLCFRLAKHCEFPELADLRDRIRAVA